MENDKQRIIIADDDEDVLRSMSNHLKRWGYNVECAPSRSVLFEQFAKGMPSLILLDLKFGAHNGLEVLRELIEKSPSVMVVMLTAHGSIETAVAAMKQGAYDYLTKPPDLNRLQVVVDHAIQHNRLSRRIDDLEQFVDRQAQTRPLIWGESPAMQRIKDLIVGVAPTNATVLILGESGAGKELVAREVHARSPRANGPFIPVNMAALPGELVESTLFGHEKGAFTGADRAQTGCCEAADKGTLFLDEIGEMRPSLQSKLLRFLQERNFQRVGSSKTHDVDVRIIAATNQNLAEQVKAGNFREDLFYRLNVVPIELPPLRERREDVAPLANRFLQRAALRHNRPIDGFTPEAETLLSQFHWPGNVRQLENMVEKLVIFSREREIGVEVVRRELDPAMLGGVSFGSAPMPNVTTSVGEQRSMDEIEKLAIVSALEKANGNVGEAARSLGLGQATVYRKIKRYDIKIKKDGAGVPK